MNVKDVNKNTPLMEAALKGNLECCQKLISKSPLIVDINVENLLGKTALHKAAYNGHDGIVELLLKNGADPKLTDNDGKKPIDYAIDENTRKIL